MSKTILELTPAEACERLERYDNSFDEYRVIVPAYDINRMFTGSQILSFVQSAVTALQNEPKNKIAAIRAMRDASGLIPATQDQSRLGLADAKYIVEAIMELLPKAAGDAVHTTAPYTTH